MRRYGQLWESITSWPNLLTAARKARRGKRLGPVVRRFEFATEWELLHLQNELRGNTYRPGPFTTHTITRPKPRLISAAPYRDRVVHHAVMNVLEPIFDRHFHPDSYACRKGKGTHAAADRLQTFLKRYRFLISCDVRKFFPSIDHEILKDRVRRRIKDARVLTLLDTIIDHSNEQDSPLQYFPGDNLFTPLERRRGLPIGNLTSQWLANLYLDPLDHFITSKLGCGGYVRYCDDFVILGNDPAALRTVLREVIGFLDGLRLKLHEERSVLRPSRCGVTFVGFRTWSTHRYLRKANIRAFRRRLRWMKRAYAAGRIDLTTVEQRIAAWLGHAMNADSRGLIERFRADFEWFRYAIPTVDT